MATFRVVRLGRNRIQNTLALEEAAFRSSPHNWLVLSRGIAPPTVVLGLGGKVEQLVAVEEARRLRVDAFRRFTGGGTVVVDDNTLFVSIIANSDDVQYGDGPRALMQWTADEVYEPVFSELCGPVDAMPGPFALREHDFVFGDKKFGGNAQGLSRGRFVHHTSFLWDFSPANMAALQLPAKQPEYRAKRDHDDFLCRLKTFVDDESSFEDAVVDRFTTLFHVEHADREALEAVPSPSTKRQGPVEL